MILQAINYASLILFLLSVVYTLNQIISKIMIRKYRLEMTDTIIFMMQTNKSESEIIQKLTDDGYPSDAVAQKISEVKDIMSVTQQNQANQAQQ